MQFLSATPTSAENRVILFLSAINASTIIADEAKVEVQSSYVYYSNCMTVLAVHLPAAAVLPHNYYAYIGPYAYGTSHTRMGRPIRVWDIIRVWANIMSHTRMGVPYEYTRMGRPIRVWDIPYTYIGTSLYIRS